MVVLAGSSGSGAGMLVARVERVCMQQGQSKQLAHLHTTRQGSEKGPRLRQPPDNHTGIKPADHKLLGNSTRDKGQQSCHRNLGNSEQQ